MAESESLSLQFTVRRASGGDVFIHIKNYMTGVFVDKVKLECDKPYYHVTGYSGGRAVFISTVEHNQLDLRMEELEETFVTADISWLTAKPRVCEEE